MENDHDLFSFNHAWPHLLFSEPPAEYYWPFLISSSRVPETLMSAVL
jgi:hypothetical protein